MAVLLHAAFNSRAARQLDVPLHKGCPAFSPCHSMRLVRAHYLSCQLPAFAADALRCTALVQTSVDLSVKGHGLGGVGSH